MVPALMLTYFVALFGALMIAANHLGTWGIAITVLAVILIERELFMVRRLVDGDDVSDEPHHDAANAVPVKAGR
jgi:hypothetical protein